MGIPASGMAAPAAPVLSVPERDALEAMLFEGESEREGSLKPRQWNGQPVDLELAIDRLVGTVGMNAPEMAR